jgi:hypothetical protein
MNMKKIEMILLHKLCPKCNIGMVQETGSRVYTCLHSRCGEVFDFSIFSDTMIREIIEKCRREELLKRRQGTDAPQ